MRVLIVFDDMIAEMRFNKKLIPIFTELFLRGRKRNILLFYLVLYHNLISKYLKLKTKCNTKFYDESS